MAEFNTPEFLLNRSTDDFHSKMKTILPSDIDISQGGHAWNLTRPTALVAAEICEFILPEVVRLIYPKWSYGDFLDEHARVRNMTRLAATAATGEITIAGEPGTVIPEGSLFATAAVNDEPSIDYATLEEVTIPESGAVTVPVQCTIAGTAGNTQADTVVLVGSRISGVSAVTNQEPITGGTEEESDESLQERIDEYDKSQGNSFTGCPADYKRWAMSVDGVGEAVVLSATDDTGLVTIILTDANGEPATEQLCEAVYNYIMRPDDPYMRLAPVNAFLSVRAPDTLAIRIRAIVEMVTGATMESVKADFLARMAKYLPLAMDEGEVKYSRVAAILSATAGVNDYKSLQIGTTDYDTDNIAISSTQLPVVTVDELDFTDGNVTGGDFPMTALTYKGSVETVGDLPAGAEEGDLYFVVLEDTYYAWINNEWIDVGDIVAIEALSPAEIDAIIQAARARGAIS